jgi:hypothetical protein
MARMKCARLIIIVALLAASGCSADGEQDDAASPSDAPGVSPDAPTSPTPEPWSIEEVRVDRIADDLPRVASKLPAFFPPDDSDLPDLLADPPGRARLAYHPRESFDDRDGWADERVFFLGLDGSWRVLNMLDLGLPDSLHLGPDTYGAGDLSPDGTMWAARTNAGVVLLDLETSRAQQVPLPGSHTQYMAWDPDSRSVDVMRLSGASTHRTWTVDARAFATQRASYRLPIDGFAHDGSVVTFTRRGTDTVRVMHRDGERQRDRVAVPYRTARLGGAVGQARTMFGLNRELLVVDDVSWTPEARLRLEPGDMAGWPRGWLDSHTVWFYEGSRGLLTWDVVSGETGVLTRVRPPAQQDTYWTASIALDLMR